MSADGKELVDPILVKVIENNIRLEMLMVKVDKISVQQDTNHVVSLALREHKTIERVDAMWAAFAQLRLLVAIPSVLVALAAITTVAHNLWRWPF